MRKLIIVGAGGRDFHNVKVAYRNDPSVEGVAFGAGTDEEVRAALSDHAHAVETIGSPLLAADKHAWEGFANAMLFST